MIREDGFGVQKAGIDRKMLLTAFTKIPQDLLSATKPNNSISMNTDGAFVFLHMPHLELV